jgi:integrase
MPTIRKGARLWLRPSRRDRAGRIVARAVYLILDAGKHYPTGCFAGEADRAERKLVEYIAAKYQTPRKERELGSIDVSDVLSIYVDDRAPKQERSRRKFDGRISRLNEFWGGKKLSDVTAATCRAYAEQRKPGGARRDLEDLKAAINHHGEEGYHRSIVKVTLPPAGQPRERWLTRSEAAKLLWACWRHREIQLRHRGPDKGRKLRTNRYPLRHLARFILIALYTGTRAGAIASASPYRGDGRSFVDLERGVYYRLPQGTTPTKKRQPPAPIPARLLAHMRRWERLGLVGGHFVEFNGKPIRSVKTAFSRAVRLADLSSEGGKIVPHTLRHTAATWLMQRGASIWEAAGYLGMSAEMLERVYGHHSPYYLKGAATAITGKDPADVSVVDSVVGKTQARTKVEKNK